LVSNVASNPIAKHLGQLSDSLLVPGEDRPAQSLSKMKAVLPNRRGRASPIYGRSSRTEHARDRKARRRSRVNLPRDCLSKNAERTTRSTNSRRRSAEFGGRYAKKLALPRPQQSKARTSFKVNKRFILVVRSYRLEFLLRLHEFGAILLDREQIGGRKGP
jgi:hypothetical protein